MAVGEYISVSRQRDSEAADVETERLEQARGPAARQRELVRSRASGGHQCQADAAQIRSESCACCALLRCSHEKHAGKEVAGSARACRSPEPARRFIAQCLHRSRACLCR